MDRCKTIGDLRADDERAVAAVGGSHRIDFVGIDLREEHELLDQFLHQRADRIVVEAVPGVVRRAQGEIDVASVLGMLLIVGGEHIFPLVVVDLLRRAAAAMHGDHQPPAVGRLRANVAPQVGTDPIRGSDGLLLPLRPQGCLFRRGLIRLPCQIPHLRIDRLARKQLFRLLSPGHIAAKSIREQRFQFRVCLRCCRHSLRTRSRSRRQGVGRDDQMGAQQSAQRDAE